VAFPLTSEISGFWIGILCQKTTMIEFHITPLISVVVHDGVYRLESPRRAQRDRDEYEANEARILSAHFLLLFFPLGVAFHLVSFLKVSYESFICQSEK
jgi:hypothetical protein